MDMGGKGDAGTDAHQSRHPGDRKLRLRVEVSQQGRRNMHADQGKTARVFKPKLEVKPTMTASAWRMS